MSSQDKNPPTESDDDYQAEEHTIASTEVQDTVQEWISHLPESVRSQLTDDDMMHLEKAVTLEEFIAALQEIRDRELEKISEIPKYEQMMEEFYEGKNKEEKRIISSLFHKLKTSMVNLSQNSIAKPTDTPVNPEVAERKGKDSKER